MNLDHIEISVVETYKYFTDSYLKRKTRERTLGFELDEAWLDSPILGNNLRFVVMNFDVTPVPGTQLVQLSDAGKDVDVKILLAEGSERKLYDHGHLFRTLCGQDVNFTAMYNGKYFLVTSVTYGSKGLMMSMDYATIVVFIYKLLTSSKMGTFGNLTESVGFIKNVDPSKYTPVTISYVDMLEKLSTPSILNSNVLINPKYDGVAMWLFVSETTPLSILSQRRSRGHNSFKYVGRLSHRTWPRSTGSYAIACEKMTMNGKRHLVAVDCFNGTDKEFLDRKNDLFILFESGIFSNDHIQITPGYTFVFQWRLDKRARNLNRALFDSETRTICDVLDPLMKGSENTDGYVMYVNDERPVKVKLAENLTVDVEYIREDVNGVVKDCWITDNEFLRKVITEAPSDEMCPKNNTSYVLEVSLHTGKIVRERNDRKTGNSPSVTASIVSKYMKDRVYSTQAMWSGDDLRLILLINRMFKRYCHLQYFPKASRIVDLGSGNGADCGIWDEQEYHVLAVENDRDRFHRLQSKTNRNSKVVCRLDDMTNVMSLLSKQTMSYKHVSFMRSIGHLNEEAMKGVLVSLRKYGVKTVMIVAMIEPVVHGYVMADNLGQSFKINTKGGNMVELSYKINGKEAVSYVDRRYTLSDWKTIASECGYSMEYMTQAQFTKQMFHIERDREFYPCFTDACVILRA